ncbi:MAG: SurA N-terminal domain-containing protein [Caldimicrobium sp.]
MFEFLRKGATSLFAKIFLAIIVIVFIFWGIGSFTSSDRDLLAKVNGEKITLREFQEYYHYKLLQIKQTLGELSDEEIKKLNLKEQVLQELIQRKILMKLARDFGVYVSKEEVKLTLSGLPYFQENGDFSQTKYNLFLREIGLSPATFEKLLYSDLLEQKLKLLISAPLLVSKGEVEDYANFYFQKLSLEEYVLPNEVCEKEVNITQEALENYFHANRNKYVEEEKVKLAYLKIPFTGEVEISEEELKNYYVQNVSRFKEPFKVKLKKFLVSGVGDLSLKKAQEERNKLKSIKDFEKIGIKEGEWFEEEALPQEVKEWVKRAKAGDILGPLKTSQGYLILGIEEVKPERILKFEEVKGKLKEELEKEKIRQNTKIKANEMYSQVIKENSLVKWAEKKGVKLEITNYLNMEETAKLLFSREASSKIFKGGKGDYFSPFETEKFLYIVEILDKKPKRNLTFEEAKDLVMKDFLKEKGKEICEKKVKNFMEKGKSSQNLTTIARERGFKIYEKEVMRAELPAELINSLTHQGLSEKPLWNEKEVKLIYVKKISPMEKKLTEDEFNFIKQLLLKYKSEEVFKDFILAYQKKVKIRIYPLYQQI